jgi:ubiquinol-cytochrome c reductase cytochrome b subunit
MLQILTGFFLTFYYSSDYLFSFCRIQYIMYEVNLGWVFRIIHFNLARLLFMVIYLHFFKGLYFFRYRLKKVWLVGILILLLIMAIAFTGYVLVWGQMRF